MSDLIERQKAINGLEGYIDDKGIFNQDRWFVHGIKTAITHLKGMSPAQPEQRWIPVDLQNNSPEENKVVLLGVHFRDDFKYFVTSRQDYNYWTGLGREIRGELRWQPLPEPYRKESDSDDQT